jgi:hypothetical protein
MSKTNMAVPKRETMTEPMQPRRLEKKANMEGPSCRARPTSNQKRTGQPRNHGKASLKKRRAASPETLKPERPLIERDMETLKTVPRFPNLIV